MCQAEILDWLEKRKGTGKFFTTKEIAYGVNSKPLPTARKMNKLYTYDFVEVKCDSYFPVVRSFRLK